MEIHNIKSYHNKVSKFNKENKNNVSKLSKNDENTDLVLNSDNLNEEIKLCKNIDSKLSSKEETKIVKNSKIVNENICNLNINPNISDKVDKSENSLDRFELNGKTLVKISNKDFFQCDAVELAKKLIGKIIVRFVFNDNNLNNDSNNNTKKLFYKIVETEAYMGPEDKACHAYDNKKTEKTKYFWCEGGSIYVFHIYSVKNMCFNIIANDTNTPHGVLIRAVEPMNLETLDFSFKTRNKENSYKSLDNPKKLIIDLFNGPGKVGISMNIDKTYNGKSIIDSSDINLFYEIDKDKESTFNLNEINENDISASKRINIDYAKEYIDKLWRFTLNDNPYVIKVKQ